MKYKKLVIAGAIILMLGFVGNWLYSHSYIEIHVTNATSGDISYSLEHDGSKDELTDASRTVKKLVSRGEYEALVTQHAKSAFAVIRTEGFLRTTRVTMNLQDEKSREFVGDNPSFCMYYSTTYSQLFSYNCGGSFTDLKIHIPSTIDIPTYVNNPLSPEAPIKGIVSLQGSPYILIDSFQTEEDGSAPKALYKLKPDLALDEWVEIPDLNTSDSYSIQDYKEGFIAYDDSYSDIKYFSGVGARAAELDATLPDNGKLAPTSLKVNGESIIRLFSEERPHDDRGLHDNSLDSGNSVNVSGKSEVIITTDEGISRHRFNQIYFSATTCGTNKLCMYGAETLDVYDANDKPKKLYSIHGVDTIEATDEALLVVRKKEVISFDVDRRSGYTSYSFGERGYCGIQVDGNNYIICAADNSGSSALYVNTSENTTDAIDKKIGELESVPEVLDVSIYRNLIHVLPDAEERVYLPEIEGYDFDPVKIREANDAISKAIDEIGIDRGKYTIVNPYAN